MNWHKGMQYSRHTISQFFQANTKPNLVFHLLLGTVLHFLKLVNSGEMNSNCRLFFIFFKPFLTKIFKAVFLSCYATLQPQEWEHAENVPNKHHCHRHSAGKYERGASFNHNHKKMLNSCAKKSFFIHQLLDLSRHMIPTNSWFNEPLFTA